jgi:ABC-type Zn2+ transport system substrate-binding protein/surface adhesin
MTGEHAEALVLTLTLAQATLSTLHTRGLTMRQLQGGTRAHGHLIVHAHTHAQTHARAQHDAAHDHGLDHDHDHTHSSSGSGSTSHSLREGALAVSLAAVTVALAVVSSNTTQPSLAVIGGTVLQHAVTRHQ